MDSNIHELKIDGSGTAAGGTFQNVRLNGTGKIEGSVECGNFVINGAGNVVGSLTADDAKINGAGTIEGNVKATQLKASGSCQVKGNVSGEDFFISGAASVDGGVNVQKVKVEGSIKIGGDCSAESVALRGNFDVKGLLNAEEVVIKLYHAKSRAREIGGGRIEVSLGFPQSFLRSFITLGVYNPTLETDLIEGDEITLENTTAKIVRGTNVTIGQGCDIGTVEYKGSLVKSNDARVGTETKI